MFKFRIFCSQYKIKTTDFCLDYANLWTPQKFLCFKKEEQYSNSYLEH